MRTLPRCVKCFGYLGLLLLLGCGPEVAAVPVLVAAITGSSVAATAQIDNGTTGGEAPSGDISSFDGIYHISAISVDNALVTCPSSFTGWLEADGQTQEIPRGFFFFSDCNTQSLDRIEIDGDFFFEDIDNDVCSQGGCLRLDLTVSGVLSQTQRVWRGFIIRGGEGIVFAQVDPFNNSALAGTGWRTSGGPTPNPVLDMMGTPVDPTGT